MSEAAAPVSPVPARRTRGRLFHKYVGLFIGVVSTALIVGGSLELWFVYHEQMASLERFQREQATAAADQIGRSVREIQNQMGWTTQLPWSASTLGQRRLDAQRLLRLVPAITELVQLDAAGKEQLRVSLTSVDALASGKDLSNDPAFIQAMQSKVYFGPVFFRLGSEPYMTLAVAGTRRDAGVSVAEVNLRFIWDTVSKSKIGQSGLIYVVDLQGRLIAHSDRSLVLSNIDLLTLPQVRAAIDGEASPTVGGSLQGQDVVTAHAEIPGLGWFVFVDLPVKEALAPVYASMERTGILLILGLVIAVLTGLLLTRRMLAPIKALQEGAAEIGRGDLSRRIAVATGDEFEELAEDFNGMTRRLQESYADLEGKVEERTVALARTVEDLRVAQAAAEAANVAKSSFLANMSHEIRTPMAAVIGFSDLALRTDLDAKQQDYLVKIKASAMGLLGIINDILDFSKIEAGRLELESIDFDLRDVLDNVSTVAMLRAADKGVELLISLDPDVPPVLIGDPLRLGQVLHNLVSNAIKFTEQGEVVVAVRLGRKDADRVSLNVSVTDTGIGMDEETRIRIFRPFTQADASMTRRFGGTGLGLVISRHLVEKMGGRLELNSTPGVGSRFSFSLGLGISTQADERTQPTPATLAGLRVLVVDDSAASREILERTLAYWSIHVETVNSGAEAVAAADRAVASGKPHDLILVDWRMPGMDGIATAQAIKTRAASARPLAVVMFTAYGRDELMNDAKGAQVDAFLAKPISASTLLETIYTVLGRTVAAPRRPRSEAARTTHEALAGLRILVADDSPFNRQVEAEHLAALGVVVDLVENGKDAVAKALHPGAAYDAVLMDIQMPEMDGLEATRLIRQSRSIDSLPIIALTAHALEEERRRCLDAGMNDHVTKPIDPIALQETLIRWVKRSSRIQVPNPPPAPSDVAADGLPVSLPPFDISSALQRINGKRKLLRSLILTFSTEFGEAIPDLTRLVAAGDVKTAGRIAHTLKSAAASVGLRDVAEAARTIEERMDQADSDSLTAMIVILDGVLKPALDAAATLRQP